MKPMRSVIRSEPGSPSITPRTNAIGDTIRAWLAVDYPEDKLQIVVTSDASTDETDEIVRGFEDLGVELLRMNTRCGKTAAENATAQHLRGEVIINTDAAVRVLPDSVKLLVRTFSDATVGVASGRDISVGSRETSANLGERGYVGYEMWVRELETRLGSIVGASGCFYAIRRNLHRIPVPPPLSRDFASALIARDNGYRAVSVGDAVCLVPRASSLRTEFRRKVRTMARGLDTLWYKRYLLNPLKHGGFALKLFSHKLCRWVVPLTLPLGLVGLALLSLESRLAARVLLLLFIAAVTGVLGLLWPETKRRPAVVALMGYGVGANVAALLGWSRALRGDKSAIWEPTRRPTTEAGPKPTDDPTHVSRRDVPDPSVAAEKRDKGTGAVAP
jgi:cellulose synthase/poly-beta-1,6-N-acetylglucosamine synthase-like glycosyltransferase